MKTPREILLAQHRAAENKLDEMRGRFVASLNHQDTKAQRPANLISIFVSWCLGGSNAVWRELIFPSRRIWTGLAAVWILLLLVNFSLRDHSRHGTGKNFAPSAEMMSFKEQQKLLNELLADRSLPLDAERPRIFSPKPRTELARIFSV